MRIKAQSLIEYAILVGAVAAALLAMRTYMQRAVNVNLLIIQEEINESLSR